MLKPAIAVASSVRLVVLLVTLLMLPAASSFARAAGANFAVSLNGGDVPAGAPTAFTGLVTLAGNGVPQITVTLLVDDAVAGSAVTNTRGAYSVQATLAPAGDHTVQAIAMNAGAFESRSAVRHVLAVNLPGAPTGFTATPQAGNAMALAWKAPATPIMGNVTYLVDASAEGAPFARVAATSATQAAIQVQAGFDYTLRIVAQNAAGPGPAAATSAQSLSPNPPGLVENLAATTVGTKVSLTWNAPSVTGGSSPSYLVARREPNESTWTPLGQTSSLRFDDAGTLEKTTYEYSVQARSVGGRGAVATTIVTTPATTQTTAWILGIALCNESNVCVELGRGQTTSGNLSGSQLYVKLMGNGTAMSASKLSGNVAVTFAAAGCAPHCHTGSDRLSTTFQRGNWFAQDTSYILVRDETAPSCFDLRVEVDSQVGPATASDVEVLPVCQG